MNMRDYVGKRLLLKTKGGRWGGDQVDEYRILEVAPSGNWVKLQNMHGNRFWRLVGEVSFVEELRDFKAEREAETDE